MRKEIILSALLCGSLLCGCTENSDSVIDKPVTESVKESTV